MRPSLKDQPAYDARSLSLLQRYERGETVAALAELSGCAQSTMSRRLCRARKLRANEGKTVAALHERVAKLEAALAAAGIGV